MEEAIKYKNVIREYFLEYKNRDQVLKSIFYVILFGASFLPFVFGSAKEGLGYIWLIFPMALALFAAITHTSALPTMLYLVPGSKKLREEYIGDYECGILGCACYLSHHLRTSFLCASQALGWN